ncbi:Hpt domain-containing protein [Gehongia tenuis]|uniref:Hpt domain-containing protein n=1 Tax=Gehongia tenuis TaxID=2763655 RepID=A0A926D0W3_9FIRM|nr:Hpt domain-containing protein [Gehongia tenuis]MBC8530320.1 Hpt domain-containing protein [Gehongia tenuis]
MNRNDALRAYGVNLNEVMERFINDEALYYDCLNAFIDDPSFYGLHDAILAKEYETAFHHAHTLKGVASNLGLSPLLTAVADIVEPLRKHDYSNLEQQYDAVRTEREKLQQILAG